MGNPESLADDRSPPSNGFSGALHTPVLLLVFNRPDATRRVFETVRAVRPPRLYVAADGPRADRPAEKSATDQVRAIFSGVDWPCEVFTLFRDENLGCKQAVSGGISWFFEHEEKGIILEDDVLPRPEFFTFCEAGLNVWRDVPQIGGIAGFVAVNTDTPFLSIHGSVWGWASWRRAWRHYRGDAELTDVDFGFLAGVSSLYVTYEKKRIARLLATRNSIDTWDYYWLFSRIKQQLFMVMPPCPLTSNIGFADNAGTHLSGAKPLELRLLEDARPSDATLDHAATKTRARDLITLDYRRFVTRNGATRSAKLTLQEALRDWAKAPGILFRQVQRLVANPSTID
jgi:hypothetical protein